MIKWVKLALAALNVWVGAAVAQVANDNAVTVRVGETARPWAKGVPEERQRAAAALFREANARLKESVFIEAAAKYREALNQWDHPAIHYNLVLALFYLDQPLEVREHLAAAMRYGPEPLDEEKFAQAKASMALVERQLARVHLRCDEPGAEVVMDGRTLFVAPGSWEDFVRAGPHTIVAKKAEYLTREVSRTLASGERADLELRLYKTSELTKYRRLWPVTTPWIVLLSGVAVALAGGGLHAGALKNFQAYDQTVRATGGSAPEASLVAQRSRGEVLWGSAVGCYAAGGATLVTGAILLFLNRLQPYQELPPGDDPQPPRPTERAWQLGLLLGDGVGLQAVARF